MRFRPRYRIPCIFWLSILLITLTSNNAQGQCNSIDFKANTRAGCPLLLVKFSVAGATSASGAVFQWDFGNGYIKGNDTITQAFANTGKYNVKLLATLPGAGSACPVVEKDTFISVYPVPSPEMKVSPGFLVCNVHTDVIFTDNTPGIKSRYWYINGTRDTSKTTDYTFPSSGFMPITLYVTNKYNCPNTLSKTVEIYDSVPVDIYGYFTAYPSYTKATFAPYIYNSGTNNNTVTGYTWSLPGASIPSYNQANTPSVTYANIKKKYDVSLKINVSNGCSYTDHRIGYVYPFLNPQLSNECAQMPYNVYGDTGDERRFNFRFLFPGADHGTIVPPAPGLPPSFYGTLNYRKPGKYPGQFTYYEIGGDSVTVVYPQYINIVGPADSFYSQDNQLCKVGDTVHLINATDTTGAPGVRYTWYILDSSDKKLIPGHNYIGPTYSYNVKYAPDYKGVFGVSMVAISSNGCRDSINAPAFITIVQPKSDFGPIFPLQCYGQTIKIIPDPTPPEGVYKFYKFDWVIHNEVNPSIHDTIVTPVNGSENIYDKPPLGLYDVYLKVSNGHCSADTVKKAIFKVIGDSTDVFLSSYAGCLQPADTIVAWIGSEHKYPNDPNNPPSHQWAVSPANGVIILNPDSLKTKIVFTRPGCFNVYMNVTTTVGNYVCNQVFTAFHQLCVGAQVYYHSPYDVFQNLGCLGDPVRFINISDTTNGVHGFKWTVIPAGQSVILPSDTATNVKIEFKKDTCYKVILTGSRTIPGATCTNQWEEGGFCYKPIIADFNTTTPTLYCAPGAAAFYNLSSTNATSFIWYFGDGDSLYVNNRDTVYHVYLKFTQDTYNVTVIPFDALGCPGPPVTRNSIIKITGPVPLFTQDKQSGCDTVTVHFTNTSIHVNKYYFVNGDVNSQIDSTALPPHTYVIPNPNLDSYTYYPRLKSMVDPFCPAFFTDSVTVYRTPTDAKITHNVTRGCAPLLVHFKAISRPADGWKWDFYSDGRLEDSVHQDPVFTYDHGGKFVARLIATNHDQCPYVVYSDTIYVQPNAIPGFIPSKKKICGAADISFQNLTTHAKSFEFNYGDGTLGDSNTIATHKYYFDPNIDTGNVIYYYPSIIAHDTDGCVDTLTDTLAVYEMPVSGFNYSAPKGCNPLTVYFSDTSKYGYSARWDFENTGKIDTTGSHVNYHFPTGLFTVKMIETSIHGCVDSTVKVNLVTVNPVPKADFSVSDSEICKMGSVRFINLTQPADSVVHWFWNFGEASAPYDTSISRDPVFTYYSYGMHTVTLTATDNQGCTGTISKAAVNVAQNTTPPNSNMLYVSVLGKDSIIVMWQKNRIGNFGSYIINLLDAGNRIVLDSIVSQEDTVFIFHDSTINTGASEYCFSMQSTDKCGHVSYGSFEHCTMLLTGVQTTQPANMLSWNNYNGWLPDRYYIYRAGTNGIFKRVDSVNSSVLSYTDSVVCDADYCYYILAVNKTLGLASKSNIVCLKDQYIRDNRIPNLRYTTVRNNNVIQVQWDSSAYKGLLGYQVAKYSQISGWVDNYAFTQANMLTDPNVKIKDSSYAYKVRTIDKCGYTGPESNPGTSVLLKQNVSNDHVSLSWNSYTGWAPGVQNYKVQIRLKNRQLKTIEILPGTDTSYTDDSVYFYIDTAYCYRVIAIENGPVQDSSVSNMSCAVLPTSFFVPNAFSPNGDNLNDVWKVSSVSVYNVISDKLRQFSMKVYDRWGTLVFESDDIQKGWDGTFQGQKAEAGVYVYIISATGMNTKNFQLNGNLTLIR